jgi:hypothetical protein
MTIGSEQTDLKKKQIKPKKTHKKNKTTSGQQKSEVENRICKYIKVISKNIDCILDVLNVETKGYVNDVDTKCLNTAIMIIMLLIGKYSFDTIDECSVSNTIQKNTLVNRNSEVLSNLKESMNSSESPLIYYILLTDTQLYNDKKENKYFPGHVLIIEKSKKCFTLYQSYINKYDLKEYTTTIDKCVCRTHTELDNFINNLQTLLTSKNSKWTKETNSFWKKLTNVDTSELIGYNVENIYICYKIFTESESKNKILSFITEKLNIFYNLKNKSTEPNPYKTPLNVLIHNFEKMQRDLQSIL